MEIQIISLAIAMAAVLVGPIVTYKITKKNMEFQFRTMTQEKWIEKLENNASAFLESSAQFITKYRGLIDRVANNSLAIEDANKEIDRLLDFISGSIVRLNLLLDENKSEQKEIFNNVIKMKTIIDKIDFQESSINLLKESHEQIVFRIKLIFQEERKKISKIFR